LQFLYYL